ncbi:hypothetical protein CPC08DRAFT_707609 [Agrocybe pediades]|nr:hypothetical protein CPC08DRAFT_707609 [Agrocybe pediades]
MPSRTPSLEDVESNSHTAEPIERSQTVYRNSSLPLEPPNNLPDAQVVFRELQSELEVFLKEHLSKIRDLQALIASPAADYGSNNYASHATAMSPANRRSMTLHPPDISFPVPSLAETTSQHHDVSRTPQRRSFIPSKPPHLESQAQAIQSFLRVHAENIQDLQSMLQGNHDHKTNATLHHHQSTKSSGSEGMQIPHYNEFSRQFETRLMTSTLSIMSIVIFLIMVHAIIGTSRKVVFSIGMLFAFFSLLIHFGNIVISSRAAASASLHEKHRDRYYFKLKLTAWQQLQYAATVLSLLSVFILSFVIFISVAFPVVLLLLFIIGASIVYCSVYLEVSITIDNIAYLSSNVQHLRQSLEYLRIRGRAIANKEAE